MPGIKTKPFKRINAFFIVQVLLDVPHQQGRDGVHRSGDLRVGHVPEEVLGLLPCRRLLQEAVRERARRWRGRLTTHITTIPETKPQSIEKMKIQTQLNFPSAIRNNPFTTPIHPSIYLT